MTFSSRYFQNKVGTQSDVESEFWVGVFDSPESIPQSESVPQLKLCGHAPTLWFHLPFDVDGCLLCWNGYLVLLEQVGGPK